MAKKDKKTKGLSKKLERELIAKYGHVPTKEEIFTKIKESQERMIKALEGAWNTAPEDPEEREKLVSVAQKAMKLREKMYEMMGDQPPKIMSSSTKPLRD